MLVSVDHYSRWPEVLFLPNPTMKKILKFLHEYIAQNGVPKRIRTDTGTAFKSGKFEEFFRKNFIKHITCPVKDHRGNGNVERIIRTLNERLRTQKEVVLERKNKGLSKILLALRSEIGKDGKSAFERHKNQKLNLSKAAMINGFRKRYRIRMGGGNFSPDVDSTSLIRERTRGSKLDETYKTKKCKVVG